MANSLINGSQLATAMIGGLVDAGVLTNIVYKDPAFDGIAGRGDTVNVRRLGVQTAANFGGTASQTDLAEVNIAVTLNHQPYVQSLVSSKEAGFNVEDFYAQVIAPGVGGVAEYLDAQVAAKLRTSTTTPVTGATARATIIAAGKALDDAKVPASDRYFAASPAFKEILLNEDWVTADKVGDGGMALRDAVIGRAFGFTVVHSTHIADRDLDNADADADEATGTQEPVGYGFHRSGLIMASRMPNPPQGGADAATAAAYGMGVRVVYGWDNSKLSDVVTVDTLAGFAISEQARIAPAYIV
mgnify:CR=1 FL=1